MTLFVLKFNIKDLIVKPLQLHLLRGVYKKNIQRMKCMFSALTPSPLSQWERGVLPINFGN